MQFDSFFTIACIHTLMVKSLEYFLFVVNVEINVVIFSVNLETSKPNVVETLNTWITV